MKSTLLALTGALCFALPAHAVTLESATLNSNLLDSAFSTPSLLALDLTLINTAPVSLSFIIDADDVAAGGADFNALVREAAGWGIGSLSLSLSGASFDAVSAPLAATYAGDLLTGVVYAPDAAHLDVSALPMPGDAASEFYLGNPFFEPGVSDWRIGFAGLNAGDRFTLDIGVTPAVPEPADWAMMLAGLGMILLSAARRLGR